MAFKATGMGIFPSMTGVGGLLVYTDSADNQAAVEADAYWSATIDTKTDEGQRNAHARKAAEDFVASQSPSGANGVTFIVNASDHQSVREATLSNGRIKLSAPASNKTIT